MCAVPQIIGTLQFGQAQVLPGSSEGLPLVGWTLHGTPFFSSMRATPDLNSDMSKTSSGSRFLAPRGLLLRGI